MMRFTRTEQLIGKEKLHRLQNAHVTICGLGAVGSYATEALARAGIGFLRLVDYDVVHTSNVNRQLYALESTIGKPKTEIAKARVLDINPECQLEIINQFIDEETNPKILSPPTSVLVDAIDSVSAKVHLIANAVEKNIHVVSSMGAAGRYDANTIFTGDLSETHSCPLAKVVRRRLHRKDIFTGVRCVYSPEKPENKNDIPDPELEPDDAFRAAPVIGSLSYVTAIFGLKAAYEVITYLLNSDDVNSDTAL